MQRIRFKKLLQIECYLDHKTLPVIRLTRTEIILQINPKLPLPLSDAIQIKIVKNHSQESFFFINSQHFIKFISTKL